MAKLSEIQNKTSEPVKQLHLVSSLESCGKGLFNQDGSPNYEETSAISFCICDVHEDENDRNFTRIAIEGDDFEKAFDVENPNQRIIVVLPFDQKIITGQHYIKGGIADCGLLSVKELSFVEFKTNALTPTIESIKEEYEKAMNQLWHTYEVIKERCLSKKVDIDTEVDIDFYIVNDKMFAQRVDQYLPVKVSSQQQAFQTDFQQEHNGYSLFFDTKREFV